MTEDKRKPDVDAEPEEDPDRAAILARRQRFVALALSGLAGIGTACQGKPQPCLDVEPERERKREREADPQPCLNVAAPRTTGEEQPTEGVQAPHEPIDGKDAKKSDKRTDGKDAKKPDEKTDAKAEEGKTAPRPCLSMKPRPKDEPG